MNPTILAGIPGVWQIVVLVLAIVLLFGGKKIPELMKGLGQGMKEFKKATGQDEKDKKESDEKKEENK